MTEVNFIDPWMVVSDIRTNQEKIDRIAALSERIKPVVLRNGALRPILHRDIFDSSFVWDLDKETADYEAEGLAPIEDITTYHVYGFIGLFKPSIAEVIACIPERLINSVAAFEFISAVEPLGVVSKEDRRCLSDGYHIATMRLYRKIGDGNE